MYARFNASFELSSNVKQKEEIQTSLRLGGKRLLVGIGLFLTFKPVSFLGKTNLFKLLKGWKYSLSDFSYSDQYFVMSSSLWVAISVAFSSPS